VARSRQVVLLLVIVAILLCHVTTTLAAAQADPLQPLTWKAVSSPDGGGAQLHAAPWGDVLTIWSDGTVMGLLEDPSADRGAIWVRVQDPLMTEGWMALDRLADLPDSVMSTLRDPEAGYLGGVQPLEPVGVSRDCPSGFPVKGVLEGRGGQIRLAYPPEHPSYSRRWAKACFRTLEEAAAWRYVYRPLP
jgi:hypothetical protein